MTTNCGCYVWETLEGNKRIEYCPMHALSPWLVEWAEKWIAEDPKEIHRRSALRQLQHIGLIDKDGNFTDKFFKSHPTLNHLAK